MRIAVISPHAVNNGNTSLAILIAMEFSGAGKPTCLTHVKPVSDSFSKYLNFKGFIDKTSTPSQIVKILKEGSLTGDEVRAYCKDIGPDLEAFTNQASNFSQDDMNYMFRYIAKAFPHENVIFDVDEDDLEQCKAVVKLCDVVVLNVTQSVKELDNFRKHRDDYMRVLQGKPIIVVVNKYQSTCGTLKEVANWMGIKRPNNWTVLHYNPWITWANNHGRLNELGRQIQKKDKRVIELKAELSKICTMIAKAKASGDKKVGTNKNG